MKLKSYDQYLCVEESFKSKGPKGKKKKQHRRYILCALVFMPSI